MGNFFISCLAVVGDPFGAGTATGHCERTENPPRQSKTHFLAGFNYDDNGNRDRLTYYRSGGLTGPNTTVNYAYNYDNLLTGYSTTGSGGTAPTFKLENTIVDGLGRLTDANETLTKPDNSTVEHSLDFSYDSLSQLTDANITNIGGSMWSANYGYKKDGNIEERTINSQTDDYEYDTTAGNGSVFDSDQMTKAGSDNLTWDKNGNLITINQQPATNFEYNWDGKLRSAVIGSDEVSLRYDPAGNRISKYSTAGGNRRYIVDSASDVPKVLLVLDAANNTILKTYIHTNREVLAQHNGDYTAPRYYYLHDRLGSVRLLIDDTGSVKNSYTYDPWGKAISSETQGTVSNDYRFAGYFYDDETGMYYCIARYYSPELMRFTSYDPVIGKYERPLSFHKYLYCENNPITFTDPDGREIRLGWAKPNGVGWATGSYHTLLQIIPDNQAAYFSVANAQYFNVDTFQFEFTIDAGPHDIKLAGIDDATYLEARKNGPSSDGYYPNSSTYGSSRLNLYGKNEDAVIGFLLWAYNNYTKGQTRLGYELHPTSESMGYNSNSFISGLLNRAGIDSCPPPVSVPGWYKPVLWGYFSEN